MARLVDAVEEERLILHYRRMELTLHTERLRLTPYAESDVDLSIALFTNPLVVGYAGHLMEEHELRKDMPTVTRRGGDGEIGIWCVTERATGNKIGTGALLPMPIESQETDFDSLVPGRLPDAEVEIGFFLIPEAWGKGYATEIAKGLLRFAFETASLPEVVATHDKANVASRNVLVKAGFLDRGERRLYGGFGPYLGITREEWLQISSV